MKKLVALLLLLCTFLLMFSSCSIYPSLEEWYITCVQYEESVLNGQTRKIMVRTNPSDYCPMAVHQGMTYIKSRWDGKLVFKPLNSDEELVGTYIHTLNGGIIIYFDNGEQTESGRSSFYYTLGAKNPEYEGSLNFTFRGIRYNFSTNSSRSHTPEENEIAMKEFAQEIRNGKYNLLFGNINDGILTCSTYGVRKIDLLEEFKNVMAVRITSDNRIIILDELKNSSCYFYESRDDKTYTIYYIDPLP